MGKQLIIKDADFSANAVAFINATNISDQIINLSAKGHRQAFDYSAGFFNLCFSYNDVNIPNDAQIKGIDVTQYRGRKIRLICAGRPDTAYYVFFASSIDVAIPWSGTSKVNNAFTSVEKYVGKGGSSSESISNSYTLTVPDTAQYLIFNTSDENPGEVYLIGQ